QHGPQELPDQQPGYVAAPGAHGLAHTDLLCPALRNESGRAEETQERDEDRDAGRHGEHCRLPNNVGVAFLQRLLEEVTRDRARRVAPLPEPVDRREGFRDVLPLEADAEHADLEFFATVAIHDIPRRIDVEDLWPDWGMDGISREIGNDADDF